MLIIIHCWDCSSLPRRLFREIRYFQYQLCRYCYLASMKRNHCSWLFLFEVWYYDSSRNWDLIAFWLEYWYYIQRESCLQHGCLVNVCLLKSLYICYFWLSTYSTYLAMMWHNMSQVKASLVVQQFQLEITSI